MPSTESGYYRFPTIHDDHVVFVSEDDLWSVSAEGGPARRISANPGISSRPSLSPDGTLLAYTGSDEGQGEVWVMPARGGRPTRLTHLGAWTYTAGWTPNGKGIVYASDAGQPFMAYYHLNEVPVRGGPSRPLNLGPATDIAWEPGGKGVVIGRHTLDPARWKRYRGGTAGTLWIDRDGGGTFEKLLDLPGNLAGPMWIGGRIWFISDHEGVANLYSVTPTGRSLRRHTDHSDFYVRFPQTDGKRIVYCCGADLWIFDPKTGEDRKIEIEFGSARPQRSRKFADAARYLEDYDIHPEGHSLALTSRGRPFTFAFWEGAVTQHGRADGARYRLSRWLPDGKRLLAVTDESGEEELVILGPGGTSRRVKLGIDVGRPVDLAVSPTTPLRAAIANHRLELVLVDLGKKQAKVVDKSRYERIQGMSWSPDGKWLAYAVHESFTTSGIRLLDVEKGKVTKVDRPDFRDFGPSFSPDGRHLYFLSWRELDPVYDNHVFDLGFPRGCRLMVVPLTKDQESPFEPKPRAPAAGPEPNGGNAKNKKGKNGEAEKPVKVKIDLRGIEDRVLTFPVPEGVYGRIRGVKDKVLFSSYPIEGSLAMVWAPGGEPEAKGTVEAYDLTKQKQETQLSSITDFEVSPDGKVLVYQSGRRLRALGAGTKPEAGAESKPAGRESGWIDLGRISVSVDPGQEWAQMFREAWRLQRDHYWVPDMSGTDWQKVFRRYRPLVDRVGCRSEFSDLIWELQGELGTSHCYEVGGDYRPRPDVSQGKLGADLSWDAGAKAWVVRKIPRGDSWRAHVTSPLAAPGVNVKVGDRVLAVGLTKLGKDLSPGEALVNQAGRRVELTVANRQGRQKRTVTVKVMGGDYQLRYRDWVEKNRETVHRKTKGRVGYIHIPNMGPFGYAEFHRYYLAELNREGLVVDVRFNGGGHVSSLILEKLLRRRVGYDFQRWGEPMPYPIESAAGPMVALTNERAGSDGDIFSHCFKLYGLGPLIGKRTWGGVVGIWPRHSLVDGSLTTQPEFSFWFKDVGFGVENYGTDPDIDVDILPQDYRRGRDPQLDRGLKEIEKAMAASTPLTPALSDRAMLGLPRLPRRKK